MLRTTGKGYVHRHRLALPTPLTVLIAILARKHPCDPTVGKIAAEFAQVVHFTTDRLPWQQDIWWQGDLGSVTFRTGTVCYLVNYRQSLVYI